MTELEPASLGAAASEQIKLTATYLNGIAIATLPSADLLRSSA